MHEFKKKVNIFLQDIDVIATFSHGGTDLTKDRASSALQFAEKMLNPHWVRVIRVVVEVLAPASLPDLFKAELPAGQIENM